MKNNFTIDQSKSEGFDSCDRPSNLTQIWFKSSIFRPLWPWNLMDDHRKKNSFVFHFKIGEFKLKLQSGNPQCGSKLEVFYLVSPLKDNLEEQQGTSSILLQALYIIA